jgi:hypothetical protein
MRPAPRAFQVDSLGEVDGLEFAFDPERVVRQGPYGLFVLGREAVELLVPYAEELAESVAGEAAFETEVRFVHVA